MIKLADLRPEKLSVPKPTEVARKARHRVHVARIDGSRRLWTLETDALARAGMLLGKAPDGVPVVSRVIDAAERFLSRRLELATAVPIAGYDELNAKQIRNHLRELSPLDLARLQRYEAGHKHRKSVIADIEKELSRRVKLPDEALEADAVVQPDAAQA